VVPHSEEERHNYHYVVLEIDSIAAGITRDDLVRTLHAENVLARRYFFPGCHRMEPYRTLYPDAGRFLPETERLTERVLCLPTGSALAARDVDAISGLIRFAVAYGPEISRHLAKQAR